MATGGKELSQMSCEDFGEFKVAYPTVMFKYIGCNIVCVKVLIFEKQCNSATVHLHSVALLGNVVQYLRGQSSISSTALPEIYNYDRHSILLSFSVN